MSRIRHAIARWVYDSHSLEFLCQKAVELGYEGIDLLHPGEVATVRQFGLECPVTAAPEHESGLGCIERALNHLEHHDTLVEIYQEIIPAAAEAGVPLVICFSGNRDGLSDQQGLENCAKGLGRLLPLAEKHGVTLLMELLNSKVDHPDYQCDRSDWGVALCELVDTPRFKLLYDIYHMQVMEGDVIATIGAHGKHFGHYHTGGVPGRNEIDDSQELNYPAIVKAIEQSGYEGFLAQEFIPLAEDPFASLEDAIRRCRV